MRNYLFNSNSAEPFRLSRSKIDLFLECPRCFYLDRKLGIRRPSLPSFSLNSAVDDLLKKEFDILRKNGNAHEIMEKYGIRAVPLDHPEIPIWRDDKKNFIGASVVHKGTNFEICGAVDDIWVDNDGVFYIVDYKSTSTQKEISLDDQYKEGYKKQMEVYQWIFRQKGFKVSDTGYFVFANASKDRPKFDGRLEFELSIVEHRGDDSWVENTLFEIKKCLLSSDIPASSLSCEYCNYLSKRREAEK